MGSWYGPFNSGLAVGANGSATANRTTVAPLLGTVKAFYIRYNDSPPAGTTDVTIATGGGNSLPALTLLKVSNAATDGMFIVAKQAVDATGAAIAGSYFMTPIADYLNIKIEGANAGDSADVWAYAEQ